MELGQAPVGPGDLVPKAWLHRWLGRLCLPPCPPTCIAACMAGRCLFPFTLQPSLLRF